MGTKKIFHSKNYGSLTIEASLSKHGISLSVLCAESKQKYGANIGASCVVYIDSPTYDNHYIGLGVKKEIVPNFVGTGFYLAKYGDFSQVESPLLGLSNKDVVELYQEFGFVHACSADEKLEMRNERRWRSTHGGDFYRSEAFKALIRYVRDNRRSAMIISRKYSDPYVQEWFIFAEHAIKTGKIHDFNFDEALAELRFNQGES